VHSTKGTPYYIHSDLWGPSPIPSKDNGSRYKLTFIDDFLRKVWVFFLKEKSKLFTIFKQWKHLIENQTGKKIKRLKTDNGLELCNEEFNKFCKNEEIIIHRTVIDTPQQNVMTKKDEQNIARECSMYAFTCRFRQGVMDKSH
jgi:Integrase core domain